MRLALAIVLSLPLLGCNLVLPYESTPLDAAADIVEPGCVSGGCVECDPVSGKACPACDAGSCCPSGDCDELDDSRDPWPGECNPLQFQEDFSKKPDRWGRSYNELFIGVKQCGLLEWRNKPHFTIWAWLDDTTAATIDEKALVEARISPTWGGDWRFSVNAQVEDPSSNDSQGRFCHIEYGDDRHRLGARAVHSNGTSQKTDHNVTIPAHSLVLQNWVAGGKLHCRLVPDKGKPLSVEVDIEGSIKSGGTVEVTNANRNIHAPYVWMWMDWVRAYGPGTGG